MQKPNISYFSYPGVKEAYKLNITTLFRLESQKCYEELRNVICTFYGADVNKFHKKDRSYPLSDTRHLFSYIAKMEMFPQASLSHIGKFIYYNPSTNKQYDHTTVLYGIQEIRNKLNPKIQVLTRRDIDKIIASTIINLTEVWLTLVSTRKKMEIAVEILQSKS